MTDMKSALMSIRQKVTSGAMTSDASAWKADGVDHINITIFGRTALGRFLDIAGFGLWDHPAFGEFNSLYNFRFYLEQGERNDVWRYAEVKTLQGLYRKELKNSRRRIANIDAALMHCAYIRILQHPEVVRSILACELPFDSYRKMRDTESGATEVRQRHAQSMWLTKGYEEIRSALRENREPDFSSMIFVRRMTMYEDMIRTVIPGVTSEEVRDQYEPAIVSYANSLRIAVLLDIAANPNGAVLEEQPRGSQSRGPRHTGQRHKAAKARKLPAVHVTSVQPDAPVVTIGGGDEQLPDGDVVNMPPMAVVSTENFASGVELLRAMEELELRNTADKPEEPKAEESIAQEASEASDDLAKYSGLVITD